MLQWHTAGPLNKEITKRIALGLCEGPFEVKVKLQTRKFEQVGKQEFNLQAWRLNLLSSQEFSALGDGFENCHLEMVDAFREGAEVNFCAHRGGFAAMPHNHAAGSDDIRETAAIMDAGNNLGELGIRCHAEFKMFRTNAQSGTIALKKIHPGFAYEARHELAGRFLIDFPRGPALLDAAGMKNSDTLPQRERVFMIMSDIQKCARFTGMNLQELMTQLKPEVRRQAGKRFIHQKDGRFADKRPAKGDALGFASGKFPWPALQQGGQLKRLGQLRCPLSDFGFRDVPKAKRKRKIFSDREVRIERVRLEDKADVALVGRQSRDVTTVKNDSTRIWLFKSSEKSEQCGFARSGRANNRDSFARVDFQDKSREDGRIAAKALFNLLQANGAHGRIDMEELKPFRCASAKKTSNAKSEVSCYPAPSDFSRWAPSLVNEHYLNRGAEQ